MSLEDIGIALRVDHQRDAHRLNGLVNPGIGEDVAFVIPMRLAAQRFAGIDEVVDAALPNGQIFAVDLIDAVRNPVDDQ